MHHAIQLRELESLHDEEFVNTAYQRILQRPADQEGRAYYLNMLRSGTLRKIDIIVRLRLSPEGREIAVPIEGFIVKAILSVLRQTPIVGWLIFLPLDILRLPFMLRPLQAELADMRRIQEQQAPSFVLPVAPVERIDERFQAIDQRTLRIVNSLDNAIEIFSVLNGKIDEQRNAVICVNKTLDKHAQELFTLLELANNVDEGFLTQNKEIAEQKEAICSAITVIEKHAQELSVVLDVARKAESEVEVLRKKLEAETQFAQLPIYAAFEDTFRGSEALIYDRAHCYLPMVYEAMERTENAPVLDLGCGRGEWLRLLTDNGVKALGVDSNPLFVQRARGYGMEVYEENQLDFLRSQPANMFGVISAFHVVEHLSPSILLSMLEQCQRILRHGGIIIFETPNPMNLRVGSYAFHLDVTHKLPLAPCLLEFFAKAARFGKVASWYMTEGDGQRRALSNTKEHSLSTFEEYWNVSCDYAVTGMKI